MDRTSRAEKTVLVVDDGDDIRAIYADALGFSGYHVIAVGCAAAAFAQLGHNHIDAILTDLWMPRMSGAVMAAVIRADARHCQIPISLISSAPPDSSDAALFNRILHKPCEFEELLATVDSMCFSHAIPTEW